MSIEQLIVSIGAILLAVQLFGWIFQSIGQPKVVGEIVAGIVLGPSVLGGLFPSAVAYIFPASSLPTLAALSQLGLLLFMFAVGLEVDLNQILKRRLSVVVISNVSILLPLALGAGFAAIAYSDLAGDRIAFAPFALFVGTAMSVTAFPVLARILKERNLLSTETGIIAISCAAVDDVSAWLLLAILTAVVHSAGNWSRLGFTLLWLLGFVTVMLVPVRRALAFVEARHTKRGHGTFFVSALLLMLAASWATERLGVHPLFGAFVAGLVVPKGGGMAARTRDRIESVTLAFFLPLFFALTGLRTRIDLLQGGRLWTYVAAIIAIAVAGKVLGATVAARMTGMEWGSSLALGALMNTRGLVELVILNAGMELGILSPTLFTMMVIMALITTFMTTPLLNLLLLRAPAHQKAQSLGYGIDLQL
ncbi:MAG TPA: cation:proton antiporter [Terriglobales bacterium]|nr:cation:proton antiporter [Terriglobales bacterium]